MGICLGFYGRAALKLTSSSAQVSALADGKAFGGGRSFEYSWTRGATMMSWSFFAYSPLCVWGYAKVFAMLVNKPADSFRWNFVRGAIANLSLGPPANLVFLAYATSMERWLGARFLACCVQCVHQVFAHVGAQNKCN